MTLIPFGNFAIVLTSWYRRASSSLPRKLEKCTMSHEIYDVFPQNRTHALQNMPFSQYFTTQFYIFSLNLTGESVFLFYVLVRTTNFLWVVLNKVWMIRFFAVVNYMVGKFSFCRHLCADVIANIILLNIFISLKIVFISFNMILKSKSFFQIVTFIIHKKRLTSSVAVNFVDETRHCTSMYIPHSRCTILENTLWENRFY